MPSTNSVRKDTSFFYSWATNLIFAITKTCFIFQCFGFLVHKTWIISYVVKHNWNQLGNRGFELLFHSVCTIWHPVSRFLPTSLGSTSWHTISIFLLHDHPAPLRSTSKASVIRLHMKFSFNTTFSVALTLLSWSRFSPSYILHWRPWFSGKPGFPYHNCPAPNKPRENCTLLRTFVCARFHLGSILESVLSTWAESWNTRNCQAICRVRFVLLSPGTQSASHIIFFAPTSFFHWLPFPQRASYQFMPNPSIIFLPTLSQGSYFSD